jgi:hypothetical protein
VPCNWHFGVRPEVTCVAISAGLIWHPYDLG